MATKHADLSFHLHNPREAVEADVSAGSVEDLAYGVDNALGIESGLPQNLGKRFAFTTDTLKRFRVSTAPTSLVLLDLSIGKNGGLVLMWKSRSWILTTLA